MDPPHHRQDETKLVLLILCVPLFQCLNASLCFVFAERHALLPTADGVWNPEEEIALMTALTT